MNDHDRRRRTLLLGTLAGVGVIGVSVLTGCRDETVERPGPDTDVAEPGEGAKLSQEQAEYRDTPQNGEKCSNCQHFIAESNTCAVVEGEVSPDGWCKLWVEES
jgi:hypothetical protein